MSRSDLLPNAFKWDFFLKVYFLKTVEAKSLFSLDMLNQIAGPHSAVSNVSGYRCVSDCRSRGREFDPGPVPYFRGD